MLAPRSAVLPAKLLTRNCTFASTAFHRNRPSAPYSHQHPRPIPSHPRAVRPGARPAPTRPITRPSQTRPRPAQAHPACTSFQRPALTGNKSRRRIYRSNKTEHAKGRGERTACGEVLTGSIAPFCKGRRRRLRSLARASRPRAAPRRQSDHTRHPTPPWPLRNAQQPTLGPEAPHAHGPAQSPRPSRNARPTSSTS